MTVMKRNQIASWMAFAGGCFVIFQGIRHYPMAYDMAKEQAFAALSPGASDFLIMAVLSIGISLFTIGVLSLCLFRRLMTGDKTARAFFLFLGVMFFLRTLIELNHPVSVPVPNHLVLVAVSIESLLFFIVAILAKRDEAYSPR